MQVLIYSTVKGCFVNCAASQQDQPSHTTFHFTERNTYAQTLTTVNDVLAFGFNFDL